MYETTAQAVSLHTDYPYGGYTANFDGQQPLTDYGYPPGTGWPAVEQGTGPAGEGGGQALCSGAFPPVAVCTSVGSCSV